VKRLVAACVLASMGCAASPAQGDLVVYVADQTRLEPTMRAAADWRACGGRRVFVRATPDVGAVPLIVVPAAEIAPHQGITHRTNEATDWIRIADSASACVIGHEVGHALMGPEHFGSGLMQSDPAPSQRVTAEDCERLRGEP
jgi:hypothetical protein